MLPISFHPLLLCCFNRGHFRASVTTFSSSFILFLKCHLAIVGMKESTAMPSSCKKQVSTDYKKYMLNSYTIMSIVTD